jgi:hypothetical protein
MKNRYVICVNNSEYQASLEKRKLYRIIEDDKAEKLNLVRIIDESGEDYLYPSSYFLGIKLDKGIEEAIAMA